MRFTDSYQFSKFDRLTNRCIDFNVFHANGSAIGIEQISGPIGEALIMTALGLLVAIPAVLGYNALGRGNKRIIHRLNRFANDLHAYFVTGARVKKTHQGNDSAANRKA